MILNYPCCIVIRILGGDQMNDVLLILLDDIERTFESEEENLAGMNLKVNTPCSILNVLYVPHVLSHTAAPL